MDADTVSPVVAVMSVDRYDVGLIERKISEALTLLGTDLPRNSRVLLKPNIVSQNVPSQCTTTHPAVVEALCRLLVDRGNRVTIGESSAFYQGGFTDRGFVSSGIAEVAERCGCRTAVLERGPVKLARPEHPAALAEFIVSAEIDQADYIVSMPKLKTHSFFRMSGAVKNLFGFVPGPAKFEYHYIGGGGREAFARKLVDLHGIVKPRLCVMDAVWCLEGFGPAATGKPRHSGLLIVSENLWAADYVAADCADLDPAGMEQTRAAVESGYLPDPDDIAVAGDFVDLPHLSLQPATAAGEEMAEERDRPKEKNTLYKLCEVRPLIRRRRCDGCGECVEACPLGAVSMEAKSSRAAIDQARCLRCLHCVYVCPRRAIVVRGVSPLNLPVRAARRLLRL